MDTVRTILRLGQICDMLNRNTTYLYTEHK
nr:MAG TPA: putative translation initiation factor 2 domain protein [Caudoviricetes sp.]